MKHGTHSGYNIHKQRGEDACDACLEANRAYHRDRYRATKVKNRRPDKAIDHIRTLLANGATLRGIAAEAGMNTRHIGAVYRGEHAWIWPETEARILAVSIGWSQHIPAAGTIRRIQALRRIGWTCDDIGARLGISAQATHGILNRKRVSRDMAARVADVYDALSMVPGPSRILAKRAEARGALPPLAWDDDTIDDPAAWADLGSDVDDTADPVAVDRLLTGHLDWRQASDADRLEAGRIAMRREGGYAFCESVLHLGPRAIRRLRDEVRAERVAS